MLWRPIAGAVACSILLGLTACQESDKDQGMVWEPGSHTPTRVQECLRGKGRDVESVKPLNLLTVSIRLEVQPGGWIQYLGLEFYPTVREARKRYELLVKSQAVALLDNVVYHRYDVEHPIFAEIEQCIRSS